MNGFPEWKNQDNVPIVPLEYGTKLKMIQNNKPITESKFKQGCMEYRDIVLFDVVRNYGFSSVKSFYDKLEYYHPNLKNLFLDVINDCINFVLRSKRETEIIYSEQTVLTTFTKKE